MLLGSVNWLLDEPGSMIFGAPSGLVGILRGKEYSILFPLFSSFFFFFFFSFFFFSCFFLFFLRVGEDFADDGIQGRRIQSFSSLTLEVVLDELSQWTGHVGCCDEGRQESQAYSQAF